MLDTKIHGNWEAEQRELFEAWAYGNKWNIFRGKDGEYCDDFVQGAWCGWVRSFEVNNLIEG